MKKIIIAIQISFLFLLMNKTIYLFADTLNFDVKHYSIDLKINDFVNQSISGSTIIEFEVREDSISKVFFWLKGLSVDSVLAYDQQLDFVVDNELLHIQLKDTISKTDQYQVIVYYHGKPVKDPYWGGFYFSTADGGYAYNMGVGFKDIPHNYGRVWFPCIDNFSDKATYTFIITTDSAKVAVCSGMLSSKIINADQSVTWTYQLDVEIPTYLASVAVGNYNFVEMIYKGKEREIPLLVACLPQDTAKVKLSFINLEFALQLFEEKYVPFQFPRIGYVAVPFSSGAMEHACNIAYPKSAITGNLAYEDLMVHEFSHNWWGNLVTCSSAEDMWINEGWATYSEFLFHEFKYGKQKYNASVEANLHDVLQYAHFKDGNPYPLFPVPQEVTYGAHSYNKGAAVVHALRNYLGDSLFFTGINQLLKSFKFANLSSIDFRDSLSAYTGTDLIPFFDDWIFTPGFPHFRVNLIESADLTTFVVQTDFRFRDKWVSDLPLSVVFMDNKWNVIEKDILLKGNSQEFQLTLPFKPDMAFINMNGKITEAKTDDLLVIKSVGTYSLPHGMMDLTVRAVSDSSLLYVEHHWVGPSYGYNVPSGIKLSDYRYWTVSGIFSEGFDMNSRISYNGTTSSLNGSDCLDHTLGIENEDSLLLLYREHEGYPWRIYDSFALLTGSKTNKIGWIDIFQVKKGDYCLGIYDYKSETNPEVKLIEQHFKVYPNPAKNKLIIAKSDQNLKSNTWTCTLLSLNGKEIIKVNDIKDNSTVLKVDNVDQGMYLLRIQDQDQIILQKICIIK